ncbi:helix-turn-helix domain-containing protein [bacterium]|nr:helix-turn-helix domain-containing protein [bacterium]
MAEYLSKEEIKQWRSSLEKITLEEFAARLGKKIEQKKETNDLVDIVLHGKPVVSKEPEWSTGVERLSSIANRAYEKEKELYISPFSVKNLQSEKSAKSGNKSVKKENKKAMEVIEKAPIKKASAKKATKIVEKTKKDIVNEVKTGDVVRDEVRVVFKKALTDREQKVFDYFSAHQDQIVYAKDLADLLELPRDYVYKYIKNLRAKIEGESLQNADKGGFILSLK